MEKKTRKRIVKNKDNETTMVYRPEPVDTSVLTAHDELMGLVEEMSRNVHEVWAKSRMNHGWTFGPERNDTLKHHPDLIPYSVLPDSEKEYDRLMALNTIKLVKKLGFDIVKR